MPPTPSAGHAPAPAGPLSSNPTSTQGHAWAQPDAHGLRWQWLAFGELSALQLYTVLRLRSAVFVVEQNCVFQDMDMLDPKAMHLLALRPHADHAQTHTGLQHSNPADMGAADLVAYARCFAPGIVGAQASIGRVLTAPHTRGSGLGHALVARAVAQVLTHWGAQPIYIGAQEHLQPMYARHGFVHTGHSYTEDGIAHIGMLRPAASSSTR